MDKRSVQGGDVGISIGALISLAIAEDSFTLLKSFFFDKRYTSAGLLYFVTESEIGIVLTSITSVSFLSRTVALKQFPIVTSAVLVLSKIGIILVEARIILYDLRRI